MDHDRFDTLARALVGGASRRALLGMTGVSALGALGLAALPGADEAEAKQGSSNKKAARGRKLRRRRCTLANLRGKTCGSHKECCLSKTYGCAIPFGGTDGDPKGCCGGTGALCEFPSDCCSGLTCPTGGSTCELEKM